MYGLAPNEFRGSWLAGRLTAHRRLSTVAGSVLVMALTGIIGGCAAADNGTAVAATNSTAAARNEWPTLSNLTSGLSYRIPPGNWKTKPTVGDVGAVKLGQGAYRSPYTCGTTPRLLWRGLLGSGSAPNTDPAAIATTVARAAAIAYYDTGDTPPQVQVAQPRPVSRRTPSGATLPGVVVTAIASQHADPCFASKGEVQVLVLRFADHDGVLVVNADLAGGPTNPGPGTEDELRAIIDSAKPIGG